MSLSYIASNAEAKLIATRKSQLSIPDFKSGDTISVRYRVVDGTSERIATFKGVCIKRRNKGLLSYCVVRKINKGIGIEKTILLHSPLIVGITLDRKGKVRRSVLHYLRHIRGALKIKERFDFSSRSKKAKKPIQVKGSTITTTGNTKDEIAKTENNG